MILLRFEQNVDISGRIRCTNEVRTRQSLQIVFCTLLQCTREMLSRPDYQYTLQAKQAFRLHILDQCAGKPILIAVGLYAAGAYRHDFCGWPENYADP